MRVFRQHVSMEREAECLAMLRSTRGVFVLQQVATLVKNCEADARRRAWFVWVDRTRNARQRAALGVQAMRSMIRNIASHFRRTHAPRAWAIWRANVVIARANLRCRGIAARLVVREFQRSIRRKVLSSWGAWRKLVTSRSLQDKAVAIFARFTRRRKEQQLRRGLDRIAMAAERHSTVPEVRVQIEVAIHDYDMHG